MTKSIGQSRLLQQMKSMVKDRSDNIFSQPLENDLFIWHFTILGPQNTDFHEGIYHGQIVLPFEYPFKPPDIYFFTKNGRFEVSTKICLTITQFHPEEWNAGWTIRTMLEAVISLFNEHVPGVGFLDSTPQIRRSLAEDSRNYVCPKCGPVLKILSPRKPLPKQFVPKITDHLIQKIPLEQAQSKPSPTRRPISMQKEQKQNTFHPMTKVQTPKEQKPLPNLPKQEQNKQKLPIQTIIELLLNRKSDLQAIKQIQRASQRPNTFTNEFERNLLICNYAEMRCKLDQPKI